MRISSAPRKTIYRPQWSHQITGCFICLAAASILRTNRPGRHAATRRATDGDRAGTDVVAWSSRPGRLRRSATGSPQLCDDARHLSRNSTRRLRHIPGAISFPRTLTSCMRISEVLHLRPFVHPKPWIHSRKHLKICFNLFLITHSSCKHCVVMAA